MKEQPNAIPDIKTVQQHPETLERLLIRRDAQVDQLYRVLRGKVCPFDPKTSSYRPDFSVNVYNKLFVCIDSWWSTFDKVPLERDLFFPPQHLEPVMHLMREMSVQCKYIRALRLGWRHCEKHIRVMSAMKSGSFALRT